MQRIETSYCDRIMQNTRCKGSILNVSKGLIIELSENKNCVSKEEFLISFLNGFRSTYDPYADRYNQKQFKKFLKNEIDSIEFKLEELKFAHKICGRTILEVG